MSQDKSDKNWVETSATVAPAVLGAAAGVFLGDLIHRDVRRPIAFALGAIGVCALAPSLVENIVEKVNGPGSKRGTRRTLRNIRDAGINTDEFSDIEEELSEQMFIG